MSDLESAIDILDYILDSPRRRHLVGGVLLSVSALFLGLAITAITVKKEDE